MAIEPRMIERPAMIVVGMGVRFVPNHPPESGGNPIPGLWHRFVNRQHEVLNRVKGPSYGLIERLPGDETTTPAKELFYICGVSVSAVDPANSTGGEWLVRHIPAGKYASFTHKGMLDKLHLTLHEIYDVWLPANRSRVRPGAHLELYDHRFRIDSDESEFDTLLPVC